MSVTNNKRVAVEVRVEDVVPDSSHEDVKARSRDMRGALALWRARARAHARAHARARAQLRAPRVRVLTPDVAPLVHAGLSGGTHIRSVRRLHAGVRAQIQGAGCRVEARATAGRQAAAHAAIRGLLAEGQTGLWHLRTEASEMQSGHAVIIDKWPLVALSGSPTRSGRARAGRNPSAASESDLSSRPQLNYCNARCRASLRPPRGELRRVRALWPWPAVRPRGFQFISSCSVAGLQTIPSSSTPWLAPPWQL